MKKVIRFDDVYLLIEAKDYKPLRKDIEKATGLKIKFIDSAPWKSDFVLIVRKDKKKISIEDTLTILYLIEEQSPKSHTTGAPDMKTSIQQYQKEFKKYPEIYKDGVDEIKIKIVES